MEAEFHRFVRERVLSKYVATGDGGSREMLSEGMGTPSDLVSLLASSIMKALETTAMTPFALDAVLVVGGGARSGVFRRAIAEAIGSLAGEGFAEEKMVVPREELVEELVVLGAAVLGSQEKL